MRSLVLIGLLLSLGPTPVAAQPYERTVRDTLQRTTTSLSIENEEGSIAVSTWERDAVAYRARIISGQDRDIVEQTRVEVRPTADQLRLSTDYGDIEMEWRFGPQMYGYGRTNPEVHYTIAVPASMNVSIDGGESRVQVEDLAGKLRIEAEGGPRGTDDLVEALLPTESDPDAPTITIGDQRGPTQLSVEEGPVAVLDMQGKLAVDLDEGPLTIDEHRGALALEMEEGQAKVRVDSLGETSLATDEGRIQLTIPQDAGFVLSTDLDEEAVLDAGFDLAPFRDEEGNYRGSVRGGGPLLRIESHEGTVRLRTR